MKFCSIGRNVLIGFLFFCVFFITGAKDVCAEQIVVDEYYIIEDETNELVKFTGDSTITEAIVPDRVKSIGDSAFYLKTMLKKVTLPDGLISIGKSSFSTCKRLEEINYPSSLKSIGESAFYYSDLINNAILPEGLTYLGEDAYHMSYGASGNCGPTTVYIPSTLETVPARAFSACGRIQELTISEGVKVLEEAAFSSLYHYNGAISIPNSVIKIGSGAFQFSRNVTSVTLPETLSDIGASAFAWCSQLRKAKIPAAMTDIPDGLFGYCESLSEIEFHENVKTIGAGAFRQAKYVESIVIPDSVEKIGSGAFAVNTRLTSVTLGTGLKEIGSSAFYNTRIVSIKLPDCLERIEDYTFYDCYNLRSINVPESLNYIGDGAFGYCYQLARFPIEDKPITYIGKELFLEAHSLVSFTIPEGVEAIGASAFKACTSLKEINIPSSVKTIGTDAFRHAYSLENIIIPEGVETIENTVFYGCTALKGLSLPKTLSSLGESVFCPGSGQTNFITELYLSEKVTKIPEWAFSYCKNLKTLVVEGEITEIGSNAFYGTAMYEENFTIYGIERSELDTYASEQGITFKPLSEAPELQEVVVEPAPQNSNDLTVTTQDGSYYYTEDVLEIEKSGTYYISMPEGAEVTSDIIAINAPANSDITIILENVNIKASGDIMYGYSGSYGMPGLWISTNSTSDVHLKLLGENSFTGASEFPGIQKYGSGSTAGTMTIECGVHGCSCANCTDETCGHLTARGNMAPGIGSYYGNTDTRNITIKSGVITAIGTNRSATSPTTPSVYHPGIGSETAVNINIEGGRVTCQSGGDYSLAGINVLISGGVVTSDYKIGATSYPTTISGGLVATTSVGDLTKLSCQKASLLMTESMEFTDRESGEDKAIAIIADSQNVKTVLVDGKLWNVSQNYSNDNQLYFYLTKTDHTLQLTNTAETKEYVIKWSGKYFYVDGMSVPVVPASMITALNKSIIDQIPSQTYQGIKVCPSVVIKDGEYLLKEGLDYSLTYSNNSYITSTAKVIITGCGFYSGSLQMNFAIIKDSSSTDAPSTTPNTPEPVTITDPPTATQSPTTTQAPTDSTEAKKTKITPPKKVTISKLKSQKKKQIKITWKRNKTVDGYTISVALNRSFTKGKKTYTITKNNIVAKAVNRLVSKKLYYVKVRAYIKNSAGKKVYGSYSKIRTVKCK